MIPVAIKGKEQAASIPDIFDALNFQSYAAQREHGMSAERAQAFYVRHGVGTVEDVERWEAQYQREAKCSA